MGIGILKSLTAFPFNRRQQKIARSRKPMDREEFVLEATKGGGHAAAAEILWNKIGEFIAYDEFSPDPEDNLEYVFGIAEEELDEDIILDILTQLNIPVPDRKMVSSFGKVDTPRRIAEFVAACRKV